MAVEIAVWTRSAMAAQLVCRVYPLIFQVVSSVTHLCIPHNVYFICFTAIIYCNSLKLTEIMLCLHMQLTPDTLSAFIACLFFFQ